MEIDNPNLGNNFCSTYDAYNHMQVNVEKCIKNYNIPESEKINFIEISVSLDLLRKLLDSNQFLAKAIYKNLPNDVFENIKIQNIEKLNKNDLNIIKNYFLDSLKKIEKFNDFCINKINLMEKIDIIG